MRGDPNLDMAIDPQPATGANIHGIGPDTDGGPNPDYRGEPSRAVLDELDIVTQQRNRLRAALVGLVGVDGRDDLAQMEAIMRAMPAPAEDRAATVDAIHALIATLPQELQR